METYHFSVCNFWEVYCSNLNSVRRQSSSLASFNFVLIYKLAMNESINQRQSYQTKSSRTLSTRIESRFNACFDHFLRHQNNARVCIKDNVEEFERQ